MNTWIVQHLALIREKRELLAAGVMLTVLLSLYCISWHWSILLMGSIYPVRDVAGEFLRVTANYCAASAAFSSAVCFLLAWARGRTARVLIAGSAVFLFFTSAFVRMFDWGALYYGGNHVDSNFWAHAFYSDGTVYLTTWLSLAIYASVIILSVLLFFLVRKIYRETAPAGKRAGA